MVFAPEEMADLGIGVVKQLSTQGHGDLPGKNHIPGPACGGQGFNVQVEVIGHRVQNCPGIAKDGVG